MLFCSALVEQGRYKAGAGRNKTADRNPIVTSHLLLGLQVCVVSWLGVYLLFAVLEESESIFGTNQQHHYLCRLRFQARLSF